jgi:hypothetical protein
MTSSRFTYFGIKCSDQVLWELLIVKAWLSWLYN